MNKSYKIIFNSHSGVWVVVSELVSYRGKRCSSVAAVAAAVAVIGLSDGAYADTPLGGCTPTGGSLNEIGIGASAGTCVVQSGGSGAIGIGANVRAVTEGGDAIAIGTGAQAEASNGDMLAIGAGAKATGIDSTALGGGTLASGQDSIAIGGNGSSATQTGATTLGYNSNATGTRATALGSLANASGENAVAISNGSNSASNNGVAIGAGTITTSGTSNGVAIGGDAASRAENAIALGGASDANAGNALALGASTSVTLANSVALGSGSSATATSATTNWTTANGVVQGRTFTVNQAPTNGVVAVGNRQIQGVADGEVSATSTNAINGSQLFAITKAIADTPLSFTADSGTKVDRKLGETLKITSGTATDTATTNLLTKTNAAGDGIEISFKETPTFKGADFSGGKLINVGAGSLAMGSTDGVNGGQINTALGSVTDKLGGGTTFDPATGKVTGGFTVGTTKFNNVADAIAGTTKAIADTPLSFTADSGTKVDRKLGETLKITSGTATDTATTNLLTKTNAAGDGIEISFKETPTFKGADFSGGKLTNVGAGSLTAGSTDAVNGGQVADAISGVANTPLTFAGNSGTNVVRKLGQTFNIKGAATAAGTYSGGNIKTVANGTDGIDIQLADAPVFAGQVKANGFDANGQKVVNVGAGTATTDAVNVGQLTTTLGGNVSYNADGTLKTGYEVGGTKYDSVADAIAKTTSGIANTPMSFIGDSGTKVDRKLGETLKITSGTATDTATTNLLTKTNAAGDGIEISFKETPTFKGADFGGGKLTNVGAGSLAKGSTDGVNGGQLNTTIGSVTDKLGGGTSVNPTTGKVEGGFTVGTTTYGTVADAIAGTTKAIADTPLTFAGNSGANVDRKLGQTFNIKGAATTVGTYSGGNIKSVANGTDGIDIQLADAPVFAGQVKANGFDANGQKIVNVGAGTATTDAVNVDQLTKTLGGNVSYKSDGTLNSGFTTNTGTYGSVAEAINAVNTTASKGWNLSTNGGASSNVAPGATVDIAAASSNVIISNVGTNVKVDIAQELNLNSVKTGNTTIDSTGVAVGSNVKLGATGLVIEGGPSVTESGVDAGNKVVRNVEAGAVTEDSKEAVNGSQLYAVKQTAGRGWDITTKAVGSGVAIGSSVANIAPGDTATFTAGNNVIVTQIGKEVQLAVNPELKGLTSVAINGGPTLSSTGIAMGAGNTLNMGGNAINNVAAGTAATDAVNVSQMNTAIAAAKTKYYSVNSTGGGNLNNDGATGADAIASGKDAIASKDNAVAIGKGATADTFNSVAIGAASKTVDVVATSKTSLGGKDYQYAGTTPVGTVSVGSADNERTITNVAAGRVSATSTDAINGSQLHVLQTVLSPLLDAGGGGQVGLLPPSAGGVDSANPGRLMTQTYGFNNTTTSSVKASDCQTVNGVDSTGVGLCVKASQKGTTALGSNAQATAENATAIGFRSTANGQEAVAVGYQNTAAKQSVAIGTNNTVTGEKSIAIGVGNTVASNRSIVIGDPTIVDDKFTDDIVSIGNSNTVAAGAEKSVAIGSDITLSATQTVALGQGAKATTANSVALGASSVTGNYARTQSVSIGSSTFAFAGSGAELSTVSVGRAGSERQIQNVAAGRISKTSTDAINGSQLYATNQAVETLQSGIGSIYETLNYLDGRITNVARDANAGSASAMAMASMPQAWEANKTITSMGAATYQGESAYSMGVSRMSENGRVTLNFGATGNTRNKFGVGVGVGIQW